MEKAQAFAQRLKPLLDQNRPFPKPVLNLYADVYGDLQTLDIDGKKPISLPEVLRHRSMAHIPSNPADINPLIGLSVLVRTANETVRDIDNTTDPDSTIPGWSISVLMVPPKHVQEGFNHPLFTLRQRGFSRSELTVEGVIITQEDRLVFQGIDTVSRRIFNATMTVGGEWNSLRDPNRKHPVYGSGVMLGLSSERGFFAGLFDLFAIPNTTLPEKCEKEDVDAFCDKFRKIADDCTGVRDLADTVDVLERLKIGGGTEWVKDTLRDMRDRARTRLLLKP